MLRLGPDFRKIAIGNAASNLSDGIAFICMPLLAASISDDPLAVSGLSVACAIPRIISVLGIGVLIDRVDRRPLLYLSNFSRAVMFGVVTLLVFLGVADLWVLYVSYAVIGVIETLADSSVFAVLPKAVPSKALLDHANSRIAGTQVVIDEFVGPPLGGFLFGLAAFAPTAVNAAVLLVAGVSYVMLRGDYRSTIVVSERPSVVADLREGAAWTARHPIVRTLVIVGCIVSVGYMIPFSYLVLYASKVLGLDATGYGLLLSFSAVGGAGRVVGRGSCPATTRVRVVDRRCTPARSRRLRGHRLDRQRHRRRDRPGGLHLPLRRLGGARLVRAPADHPGRDHGSGGVDEPPARAARTRPRCVPRRCARLGARLAGPVRRRRRALRHRRGPVRHPRSSAPRLGACASGVGRRCRRGRRRALTTRCGRDQSDVADPAMAPMRESAMNDRAVTFTPCRSLRTAIARMTSSE